MKNELDTTYFASRCGIVNGCFAIPIRVCEYYTLIPHVIGSIPCRSERWKNAFRTFVCSERVRSVHCIFIEVIYTTAQQMVAIQGNTRKIFVLIYFDFFLYSKQMDNVDFLSTVNWFRISTSKCNQMIFHILERQLKKNRILGMDKEMLLIFSAKKFLLYFTFVS